MKITLPWNVAALKVPLIISTSVHFSQRCFSLPLSGISVFEVTFFFIRKQYAIRTDCTENFTSFHLGQHICAIHHLFHSLLLISPFQSQPILCRPFTIPASPFLPNWYQNSYCFGPMQTGMPAKCQSGSWTLSDLHERSREAMVLHKANCFGWRA